MGTILQDRLDALMKDLTHVEMSPKCFDQDQCTLQHPWDASIHKLLENKMAGNARKLKSSIEKIKVEPDLEKAWIDYSEIYKKCHDLFREWIEFLGGLYIRELASCYGLSTNIFDSKICLIADNLIRNCAEASVSGGWSSLTIPTHYEPLKETLTNVVRLRFSEWNIWMLPLTAHELGHVLIADKNQEDLQEYLKYKSELMAKKLIESDFFRNGDNAQIEQQAVDTARFHLQELMADAFATYTMGPAYASAAIMLKLNPWDSDEDNLPSDKNRAHIIFTMLGKMNGIEDGNPYGEVLEILRKSWDNTLTLIKVSNKPKDWDNTILDEIVDKLFSKLFDDSFRSSKYPNAGTNSWSEAKNWAGIWAKQWNDFGELSIMNRMKTGTLPDALNAAWLFRIRHPDEVKEISEIARKLCQEIIEKETLSGAPSGTMQIPLVVGPKP